MKNKDDFRVNLSRLDNERSAVFHGFYFDKDDVAEVVQKYPVKLPIGDQLYRLRFVSDDGNLVELEREKK